MKDTYKVLLLWQRHHHKLSSSFSAFIMFCERGRSQVVRDLVIVQKVSKGSKFIPGLPSNNLANSVNPAVNVFLFQIRKRIKQGKERVGHCLSNAGPKMQ